ncbi:unnamed protein product [marine sediment metagenome]|uniref:Uncharacterized protein n=1 Tax=marine sediment metagenome TaxID=412755 RepID=X1KD35_9ZZZZ
MKKKGAGMVMTIMLISVCGWIAVVGLVIKPPFWLGAILSWIGGIAIGLAIAWLMRRWWFRGIDKRKGKDLADRMIDVLKEK